MKLLLDTIMSSIITVVLDDLGRVCIVFSDMTDQRLFDVLARNTKISIESSERKNKLSNHLFMVTREIEGTRLCMSFAQFKPPQTSKTWKKSKNDSPPNITLGDEVIFYNNYSKEIGRFKIRPNFNLD